VKVVRGRRKRTIKPTTGKKNTANEENQKSRNKKKKGCWVGDSEVVSLWDSRIFNQGCKRVMKTPGSGSKL